MSKAEHTPLLPVTVLDYRSARINDENLVAVIQHAVDIYKEQDTKKFILNLFMNDISVSASELIKFLLLLDRVENVCVVGNPIASYEGKDFLHNLPEHLLKKLIWLEEEYISKEDKWKHLVHNSHVQSVKLVHNEFFKRYSTLCTDIAIASTNFSLLSFASEVDDLLRHQYFFCSGCYKTSLFKYDIVNHCNNCDSLNPRTVSIHSGSNFTKMNRILKNIVDKNPSLKGITTGTGNKQTNSVISSKIFNRIKESFWEVETPSLTVDEDLNCAMQQLRL
jgi:hypothetical protein